MSEIMDQNLHLISGKYLEIEIPKKYIFLKKYFDTEIQQMFLRYFWVFRDWKNFVDHTGIYCSERYLRKQTDCFNILMEAYEDAAGTLDEAHMKKLQSLIEGKFKVEY
jgi:N-acetylmuramoyl-L-alanine amidase CwlA